MIINLEEKINLVKWFEEIILYARKYLQGQPSALSKWTEKDQGAYKEIKKRIKEGGRK